MFIKRQIQLNKGDEGAGGFTPLSELEGDPLIEDLEPAKTDPPEGETAEEKEARELKEKETADALLEAEQAKKDKAAEDAKKLEEEAKRKLADPKKPEEGNDDPNDADKFWDEVDKLKGGEPLEVDFGDVDPLSPEGIVIRDKAIEQDAIDRFEAHLEAKFPKSFAMLVHEAAGGKIEDFFKAIGDSADLPTVAELENNADLQERVYRQHLKASGNSDKVIDNLVKLAKIDDELEEVAKEALTAETKREAAAVKAIKDEADRATGVKTTAVNNMIAFVNEELESGEIDGVVVPEKDRVPFAKEFLNSIRYDNGKFIMTTELTEENFKQVFKEKFFSFKKGDLGELVKKVAKTENANRLRRTIKANEKPKGDSGSGENFTSLTDVD